MSKKLNCIAAISISALLGLNGVNAASLEDRVETAEGTMELLEESINDLRNELDNRMRVSGYADVEYVMAKDKDPGFRMHHMSIFFQKKITSKWKFFAEIEYEDGPLFENEDGTSGTFTNTDGDNKKFSLVEESSGKIFVEAVNMDYLWRQEAAFRFGRFFTPAGIWSVDHYPPFVPTQERPGHIRKIFPQLSDGAMVYGTFQLGKHFLAYDAYYANGEGNTGHADENADKAMGLKLTAILGVPMLSHLQVGGTVYMDPKEHENGDNKRTSLGVHAKAKYKDFTLQTEAAYAKFEDGDSPKGTRSGYYVQAVYEPNAWGGGYRFDVYDSDRSVDGETTTNSVFINYRFSVNLVVKAEHHIYDKNGTDDNKTIFSVVSYLE